MCFAPYDEKTPHMLFSLSKLFTSAAAGFAVALAILLLFYKLRSKDVQTMAQYNNGEISREEADALLGAKYGPSAK